MSHRTEELRQRAAECLALARKATLPEVRAGLLMLAQQLNHMAELEPIALDRLDHAVRAFNDDELTRH